ncbi:MAG: hypothetical protein FWF50_03490 [Defluviitaleaceae bacterium]|nr:hypothetical protein [Defluviitaleaceae bacterium]
MKLEIKRKIRHLEEQKKGYICDYIVNNGEWVGRLEIKKIFLLIGFFNLKTYTVENLDDGNNYKFKLKFSLKDFPFFIGFHYIKNNTINGGIFPNIDGERYRLGHHYNVKKNNDGLIFTLSKNENQIALLKGTDKFKKERSYTMHYSKGEQEQILLLIAMMWDNNRGYGYNFTPYRKSETMVVSTGLKKEAHSVDWKPNY